jgi:hypothetical protein
MRGPCVSEGIFSDSFLLECHCDITAVALSCNWPGA